ncbi:right-handed parallel beta-helix repeat-containing protein [Falsiroseomonas sp.]|uniref:right-handed parallel beta-helix repeat-containing protein n=1 Tax=Falsiroseomonas sp. TaxID=2870721 RepID=UPI003F6FA0A6
MSNSITGLNGADSLPGTEAAESIFGLEGDDTLEGLGGDDTLIGGLGADLLNGGEGFDTADYSGSGEAVTIDLESFGGAGGDAAGDAFSSIEAVIGSVYDDEIRGTDGDESLQGGDGDDALSGLGGNDTLDGGAGNDTLTGGDGNDTLDGGAGDDVYMDVEAGDTIDEAADGGRDQVHTAIETYTLGDHLEDLEGTSDAGQLLTGNAADNFIQGASGDDFLEGGAGADTLDGGAGNDSFFEDDGDLMIGGAGIDSLNIDNSPVLDVTVVALDGGGFTVTGPNGTQTIQGLERIVDAGGTALLLVGNGGFASLQEALDAARPGDTIRLFEDADPEFYRGQFTVTRGGITIEAAEGHDITLEAPDTAGLVQTSTTINGWATYAILQLSVADPAEGAVTVRGITIDGRGQAAASSDDSMVGIAVTNSSAVIEEVTITGIREPLEQDGSLSGFSTNYGILAEGSGALEEVVTLEVRDSTITDFQKTGIIAWGPKLDVLIEDNTIIASGERGKSNQNGMQIGSAAGNGRDGTTGIIRNNTISDIAPGSPGYSATGILVRQSGTLEITGNTISGPADLSAPIETMGSVGVGLYEAGTAVTVSDNDFGQLTIGVFIEAPWGPLDTYDAPHVLSGNSFENAYIGVYDSQNNNNNEFDGMAQNALTITVDSAATVTNGRGFLEYALFGGDDSFLDTGAAATLLDAGDGDDSIVSGSGADSLAGGEGNDTLDSGAGDDLLSGGEGSNLLQGGEGFDIADYSDHESGIRVDLSESRGDHGSGEDTLEAVEGVIGTDETDLLRGDAQANLLDGGGSTDIFIASLGADTLIGGCGTDWVVYLGEEFEDGVVVSLDPTQQSGLAASGQVLVDIEGVIGTMADDWIIGDVSGAGGYVDNILLGLAGDDILDGGYGDDVLAGGDGNDLLLGGSGFDTALYIARETAVEVRLDLGLAMHGDNVDELVSIEAAVGSQFDDLLVGDAEENDLAGASGNDTLVGGAGGDLLDGGDGIDTASYANATTGVTAVLEQVAPGFGPLYYESPNTGDAAYDSYVSIENLEGSAFADALYGDEQDNVLRGLAGADALYGGAGNDTLEGGLGADAMNGGDGFDIATYENAAAGVQATLEGFRNTLTGTNNEAQRDAYVSIEGLRGSQHADTLYGNATANLLQGLDEADLLIAGDGDDTLEGGAGADGLTGGEGFDLASYASSDAAVRVDLSTQSGEGGHAEGDNLQDIEAVLGSAFGDTLTGDAADNLLMGGAGDDTLVGGAGADTLDGGEGYDLVSYATATTGLVVDLQDPSAATGDAAGDTLISIEYVTGGSGNDTLLGDSFSNILDGGSGDDFISGRGNAGDTMAGGDTLIGGEGNDTVSYEWDSTGVALYLDTGEANYVGGTDSVIGFEHAVGGSGMDLIQGNAGANRLNGGSNDDTLNGNDGDDLLQGAGGDDLLQGGAGNDTLEGGSGSNRLLGGDGLDVVDYSAAVDSRVVFGTLANELARYNDVGLCGTDSLSSIETLVGTTGLADLIDASGETVRSFTIDLGAETLVAAGGTAQSMTVTGFEQAEGGALDDAITGSDADNILSGNDGADALLGGLGNDSLMGDAGDDTLAGGAGADTLDGGTGLDTADYSASTDAVQFYLSAGSAVGAGGDAAGDVLSGIENIIGSDHNDTLHGDAGDNILTGGAGDDTLAGDSGADTLLGGLGNDLFRIGTAAQHATGEVIDGGEGNDVILFTSVTAETLVLTEGVTGVEEVQATAGTTALNINATGLAAGVGITLVGNAGANALTGNDEGENLLIGGDGADTLTGGTLADTLEGGVGADMLIGGDGNDWVSYAGGLEAISVNLKDQAQALGDAQGDTLQSIENVIGTDGDDFIRGNTSTNQLVGGLGDDSLQGFEGNDTLEGGLGADELIGGTGNDFASYRSSSIGVTVDLSGVRENTGEALGDTFLSIENLEGSAYDDILVGNGGANLLRSRVGDDWMSGGAGNDTLQGAAGEDTLIGGAGKDQLTGGEGADTFVFTSASESAATAAGRDVITDWSEGDVIDLSGFDANTTVSGTQSFVFRGVTTSNTAANAGELWVFQFGGDTFLIGGVDGDGVRDFMVEITGSQVLSGASFAGVRANLVGGAGADVLTGGSMNDTLSGAGGDDVLTGGAGKDMLTGGAGNDRFVWSCEADCGAVTSSRDVVTDFGAGDLIDLSGLDANLDLEGLQDFVFLGQVSSSAGAAMGAGQVSYHQYNGNTFINIGLDGDNVRDMTIELTGLKTLSASDFVL